MTTTSSTDAETPETRGTTWSIATACGFTATGYLPAWSRTDPSTTGVPLDRLSIHLADISHWADFDGQPLAISGPDDCGPAYEVAVFRGAIDCTPYAEVPDHRVPLAHIEVVPDHWINDLDPDDLEEIAARLRTQADYLDYEIRPQLIAARADWAAHQPD